MITATMAAPALDLLPQHRALIEGSAIAPAVAAERGYCSITERRELLRLGFSDYQCRVPALLVPVHNVAGRIATYQLRPDRPRLRDGKPLKYETPSGSSMVIDCPPRVRPVLADPTVALWTTEGSRKADAIVSAGGACIALLGVWGWRGSNQHGGRTALPDWDMVALGGRTVFLAFDSDALTKAPVHLALTRLAGFLSLKGAHCRVVHIG